MNKCEQNLIDKIYEGRFHWSHEFLMTLAGLLDDELERRIDEINSFFSRGNDDEV